MQQLDVPVTPIVSLAADVNSLVSVPMPNSHAQWTMPIRRTASNFPRGRAAIGVKRGGNIWCRAVHTFRNPRLGFAPNSRRDLHVEMCESMDIDSRGSSIRPSETIDDLHRAKVRIRW